ncbi:hypothetical protein L917_09470, partial [Phytophthora nicotianae]
NQLRDHPPSEGAWAHAGHRQRAAAASQLAPASSFEYMIMTQMAVGIRVESVPAS